MHIYDVGTYDEVTVFIWCVGWCVILLCSMMYIFAVIFMMVAGLV